MKLDQAQEEYKKALLIAQAKVREVLEARPAEDRATLYGLRGQAARTARGDLKELLARERVRSGLDDPEAYGLEFIRRCRAAEEALIRGPLVNGPLKDGGVDRFSPVIEMLSFIASDVENAQEAVEKARAGKVKKRPKR